MLASPSYPLLAYLGLNDKRNAYALSDFAQQEDSTSSSSLLATSNSSLATNNDALSLLESLAHAVRSWWQWFMDVLHASGRGLEVAVRFSPLLVLSPAAVIASRWFDSNELSGTAWKYTFMALQGLGPAFVKLAQWIGTRRDIFPPNICDRFSTLHDKGVTHSWSFTHQALVDAFGPDYADNGLIVDKDAVIGSGSAAQVYKGKIVQKNDNGESPTERSVAIKVLHPRFSDMVERDLDFMKAVASVLHSLPIEYIRMVNLPRVAENFSTILRDSSDLRIEAENLRQFGKNFYGTRQRRGESAVLFPQPVEGWVEQSVLVEDLVENAKPISAYLKDDSPEGWKARKQIAGPLLRAFLKMVFIDNFVHGDLHPGNVLILEEPEPSQSWSFFPGSNNNNNNNNTSNKGPAVKRTIAFLDAGIATSLSPNDQRNLIDLFRAVILNDGANAGRLMVERAKYERCSQQEGCTEEFAMGVDSIVSEFHDRRKLGLTLGAVRIGSLLAKVLDLCRVHGVEIDPEMASIVLCTLVLEGLGRSLQPDLNLIDFAIPFVIGRGNV